MKKILKSIIVSTAIVTPITSVALSIVSCGHNSATTNDWNSFKQSAKKDSTNHIMNIINALNKKSSNFSIQSWAENGYSDSDFSTTLTVDDANQTLSLTVTNDYLKNNGILNIKYNKQKYDINYWNITKEPKAGEAVQWLNIKRHVKDLSAKDLLGYAKSQGVATRWAASDNPHFDIYGGVFNGAMDTDNTNKDYTVTAIISIDKGNGSPDKNAYLNVHPIQATYTMDVGFNYNLKEWNFKSINQRTSLSYFYDRISDVIHASVDAKDFTIDPGIKAAIDGHWGSGTWDKNITVKHADVLRNIDQWTIITNVNGTSKEAVLTAEGKNFNEKEQSVDGYSDDIWTVTI